MLGHNFSIFVFLLLYDANYSREIYPYWNFPSFDLNDWNDTRCRTEFRFAKNDLQELLFVFGIPEKISTIQRTTCSGMEGLCILLKKLAYPCRFSDIAALFGRNPTEICLIFHFVLDHIFNFHNHLLLQWDQPLLEPQKLEEYAQAIHNRGAPLNNCFGFVDGTVCPILRPQENQRIVYNGHKRTHALKFQSLALPNGLIANLHGPYEGIRHDSAMLPESGLLQNLQQFAWNDGNPLCVYGDMAYPLSVHLQKPYANARLNEDQRNYNKAMSKLRISVEWLFGELKNYFKFIDYKKQLKISLKSSRKIFLTLWTIT